MLMLLCCYAAYADMLICCMYADMLMMMMMMMMMMMFQRNSQKHDFWANFDIFETFGPVSMETRIFGNIPYTLQKTRY